MQRVLRCTTVAIWRMLYTKFSVSDLAVFRLKSIYNYLIQKDAHIFSQFDIPHFYHIIHGVSICCDDKFFSTIREWFKSSYNNTPLNNWLECWKIVNHEGLPLTNGCSLTYKDCSGNDAYSMQILLSMLKLTARI